MMNAESCPPKKSDDQIRESVIEDVWVKNEEGFYFSIRIKSTHPFPIHVIGYQKTHTSRASFSMVPLTRIEDLN
ncbi:MAG TPA: hypothetical protein VFG10_18895 [Saprospiraceae bacterium]|nr:hypothetical protein [Saprospiraceae bacterium]